MAKKTTLNEIGVMLGACRITWRPGRQRRRSQRDVAVEVDVPGRPTVVSKDLQSRHEYKDDYMAPLNHAFDAVERQLEKISDIQAREVKAGEAGPQSGMIISLFT